MEEFIRCYEEIYPRMYKTAYYYLKNAEEAKDAVQDAALISYEKWGQSVSYTHLTLPTKRIV